MAQHFKGSATRQSDTKPPIIFLDFCKIRPKKYAYWLPRPTICTIRAKTSAREKHSGWSMLSSPHTRMTQLQQPQI
ncbi:putative sterigmatocystin biosynthesis peroxidase stcC [Fusarium oxysporum f. sp. albedinis]|nr:putative sterigmatocystin biosynthesis peroxidase stcC [Fusarium oxysporum f. sp. albedinis]